jgi:hypothetical protein
MVIIRTTRRRMVQTLVAALSLPWWGRALAQSQVSESEPLAQELGYRHNAAQVDTQRFPKRAGAQGQNQFCRTCQFFQGGGDWGACTVFEGRLVNANGWCNSWFGQR